MLDGNRIPKLRVTQSTSAKAASNYFDAALNMADYYGQGREPPDSGTVRPPE